MLYNIPNKPRVLLSNDDGIYSPGLAILKEIAQAVSDDIWTVAPLHEQSGTSHSLSLKNPLRIYKHGEKRFAVEGTPTDCVLIGINNIMKNCRPDIVLSGVNCGSNLGEDITYSGTVAATMEATLLNVPAIAFSQAITDTNPIQWDVARQFGRQVLQRLIKLEWAEDIFINVNFPDIDPTAVRGIIASRQGRHKLGEELVQRVDPRGIPYYWIGTMRYRNKDEEGTDLWAVQNNYIAVTPLHLNLTHQQSFQELEKILK